MTAHHSLPRWFVAISALCLLTAACTGSQATVAEPDSSLVDSESDTDDPGTTEPSVLGTTTVAPGTASTEAPPDLSGALDILGSTTVAAVTSSVIAGYAERQPDVTVTLTSEGSSAGINALCTNPDIELIGSARPMNGSESATCLANGVRPIELRLGRDGIAVIANAATNLQCLTYDDIYALAGPESTGLKTRQAVGAFAGELGSTTDWGSGAVKVVAPGPVHGTHQLLLDFAITPTARQRGVGSFLRVDNRSLDGDEQLVEAVAADPAAIGFIGSAFASNNSDVVTLIGVSDGAGCVLPNDAAVVAGLYPMARDLYLYADATSEDPILDDFLYYYLEIALADAVAGARYVALTPTEQAETAVRWANR